jgi:hypothetical protein
LALKIAHRGLHARDRVTDAEPEPQIEAIVSSRRRIGRCNRRRRRLGRR